MLGRPAVGRRRTSSHTTRQSTAFSNPPVVSPNTDNLSETPAVIAVRPALKRPYRARSNGSNKLLSRLARVELERASSDLSSSEPQLIVELKISFTGACRDFARIFFFASPGQPRESLDDSRAPNPLPAKLMKNKSFHCAVKTLSAAGFPPLVST